MTENEHLLSVLAEECCEIGQQVSKALRFGLDNSPPSQPEATNADRIADEISDLLGVIGMLQERKLIPELDPAATARKRAKVEKFMAYAREKGTIS